jgi:hypothetical protein
MLQLVFDIQVFVLAVAARTLTSDRWVGWGRAIGM